MKFLPGKRSVLVLLAVAAVMLLPLAANATLVGVPVSDWGGVTRTSPGEIFGTPNWNSGLSVFSSVSQFVDNNQTLVYQYSYSFDVPGGPPQKDISHFIIEVSQNAPADAFWLGGVNTHTTVLTPEQFLPTDTGNSNPGLPVAGIFGLKFNFNNVDPAIATFFSFNAPVWGDFYAKDGTLKPSGDVYAYNLGFGQTVFPFDPTQYIITPDSAGGKVPIPPSALLMGSGLLGLGLVGWRRKKQ